MQNYVRKIFSIHNFILTAIALCVIGCATISSPQGGPKDSIPPRFLGSTPQPYSTNFNGKKLELEFNEFIVLKDQSKLFFVSPQMEKKPQLSTKGKSVVVLFEDSLLADKTYRLDFGASITDNNEGNRLTDFTLTFATGDRVDSLVMVGQIVDAQTRDTIVGAFVQFFDVAIDSTFTDKGLDSTIAKSKAEALFRSDSSGYFVADILKGKDYRTYAFLDYNGNQLYEAGTDLIAYTDTTFNPLDLGGFSFGYDSLERKMYIDTVQLTLEVFKEVPRVRQRFKSSSRPQKAELLFAFGSENAKIDSMIIDSIPSEWIIEERSEIGDSLMYWINTPTKELYDSLKDTMFVSMVYYTQDSLFIDQPTRDTIKMVYTPPKIELTAAEKAEQKKKEEEAKRAEQREEREERKKEKDKKRRNKRGEIEVVDSLATDSLAVDSLTIDSLAVDSLAVDSLVMTTDSLMMTTDSLASDSTAIEKPVNPFVSKSDVTTELNPEKDIIMTFDYPLRSVDSSRIMLIRTTIEKKKGARRDDEDANIETKDTIAVNVIQEGLRRIRFTSDWVYGADYEMIIPDSVFRNIAWEANDTINSKFKVLHPDDFGTIIIAPEPLDSDSTQVSVSDPTANYIVELVKIDFKLTTRGPDEDAEKKSQTVVGTKLIKAGESAKFQFLAPDKYYIRIVKDLNGDGKWTPGDMQKRLPPEPSRLILQPNRKPKFIESKEKWEITEYVDFDALFN